MAYGIILWGTEFVPSAVFRLQKKPSGLSVAKEFQTVLTFVYFSEDYDSLSIFSEET